MQVLASLKCFREALQEVEFAVQSPTRNSSDDGSSEPVDGRAKRKRGVNSLERLIQNFEFILSLSEARFFYLRFNG